MRTGALSSCDDCSLEYDLRAKAFEIAVNDSDRQFFACAQIRYRAVSRVESPVDFSTVPSFGMPDISDAEVVLLVQKNGTASKISWRPRILRAAVCPWRSATTKCSARIRSPVSRSGQRAISPAAKMRGTLVLRYSSTVTPRSTATPARSANEIAGRTPMPTTTRSAWRFFTNLQRHASLVYRGRRRAEMERHSMFLMEFADEISDLWSQDSPSELSRARPHALQYSWHEAWLPPRYR